jgi:16S rRNA processing protein RimM
MPPKDKPESRAGVTAEELCAVGLIAGTHGLQGTLKLNPLSDFPERYRALRIVYLKREDTVLACMHVQSVRWAGRQVLITLQEITSPEAAREFRGAELCVLEADRWKLPVDVYYVSDLRGFRAVGEDGTEIGVLLDVLNGAQDILQIDRAGQELLVPLVGEWVGKIDTAARTIEILNWRRLAEPETLEGGAEPDDH